MKHLILLFALLSLSSISLSAPNENKNGWFFVNNQQGFIVNDISVVFSFYAPLTQDIPVNEPFPCAVFMEGEPLNILDFMNAEKDYFSLVIPELGAQQSFSLFLGWPESLNNSHAIATTIANGRAMFEKIILSELETVKPDQYKSSGKILSDYRVFPIGEDECIIDFK